MSSITSGSGGLPSIDISPQIVSVNSGIMPERRRQPMSFYVPLSKRPRSGWLRHAVIGAVCGERMMAALQDQAIRQHCKTLRMPTIGTQFARLADAAAREGQSHVGYLEALLAAEMEERESRAIARLLHEAKLPRMKTLEAFEFDRSAVSAAHLRTLADGDYVSRAEPVLLVGEAGTGKTHLATGLCVAACRQRRRVRFTTATALVNELAEAAHANQLRRALGRWERLDLICIDSCGVGSYVESLGFAFSIARLPAASAS